MALVSTASKCSYTWFEEDRAAPPDISFIQLSAILHTSHLGLFLERHDRHHVSETCAAAPRLCARQIRCQPRHLPPGVNWIHAHEYRDHRVLCVTRLYGGPVPRAPVTPIGSEEQRDAHLDEQNRVRQERESSTSHAEFALGTAGSEPG